MKTHVAFSIPIRYKIRLSSLQISLQKNAKNRAYLVKYMKSLMQKKINCPCSAVLEFAAKWSITMPISQSSSFCILEIPQSLVSSTALYAALLRAKWNWFVYFAQFIQICLSLQINIEMWRAIETRVKVPNSQTKRFITQSLRDSEANSFGALSVSVLVGCYFLQIL